METLRVFRRWAGKMGADRRVDCGEAMLLNDLTNRDRSRDDPVVHDDRRQLIAAAGKLPGFARQAGRGEMR